MKRFSRRDLLSLLGSGSMATQFHDPVGQLLRVMLDGMIAKAHAEESGVSEMKNYLSMNMIGGRAQMHWDLFPAPYPGMSYDMSNPAFPGQHLYINRVRPDGTAEFALLPVPGVTDYFGRALQLNPIWLTSLPRPDGSSVPMYELLKHMCSIRTIRYAGDGHAINATKQTLPSPTGVSIAGSAADHSNRPIQAVGTAGYNTDNFKSKSGVGIQKVPELNYANPLTNLMKPFDRNIPAAMPQALVDSRRNMPSVDAAIELINSFISQGKPGASILSSHRRSAEQLLYTGVGNLTASWNALKNKYTALINASRGLQGGISIIPGVTDYALNNTNDTRCRPGDFISAGDVLPYNHILNSDIRSIITNITNVEYLASNFALMEYVVTRRLSHVVTGIVDGISGLSFIRPDGSTNIYGGHGFDEHYVGTHVAFVAHAFWARAMSACLYELIEVLKADGQWQNTVIHPNSDFSRQTRNSDVVTVNGVNVTQPGAGSDHGWSGSSTSIFSGQIDTFTIMNNTRIESSHAGYAGTWQGAKVNGEHISINHAISTICALLGVPAPGNNEPSLLNRGQDGRWYPILPPPENIHETD